MRQILHPGDRVIYVKNGRKFHGTVADYLPMRARGEDMVVPVFKRNQKVATPFKRGELRKTR